MNPAGGTTDVYRLIVDSTGVRIATQLNDLVLGTGAGAYGSLAAYQLASLVYDSGRLFTSAGQILTPDTKRILGSVALTPAYGLPVPFSEQNGVVYVQSYSPQVSAIFYDLGTFRPLRSVPLQTGPPCGCTTSSPSAVNLAAAVRAGNSAIAIAANGEIVIAPLANFQPWPSNTGSVQTVSSGVRQINMPVNAISVLPGTAKLLLATPSAAGSIGNSIVTFSPDTDQIENAAFIGSEPSILAAAPDGSAVYAYLSGEFDIGRLNVASGGTDLVYPSGGSNQYQYGVFDMAASPDGGLAVSYSGTFAFGGAVEAIGAGGTIAVFDNGVLRPQFDSNSEGPLANDPATFNLAFNDSGSLLYAYNSFLSTFELKRDAVSDQGVRWLSTTGGLIAGYSTTIRYAQGLLYTSNGSVVDPERSLVVGRFSDPWLFQGGSNAVAPDVAAGRMYFATASGILLFDINTHALLGRLPVNLGSNSFNYPYFPQNLVRFGPDGLAFLSTNRQVYIVSISAIPLLPTPILSPQLPFIAPNGIVPVFSSVPVIQPGSWISIFGTNLASSTATWNNDFPTMLADATVRIDNKPAYLWYVSPNQINAQVPDDSATGTVSVTVTTASGTATASVSLAGFGPSLSLFDNQYVAAEILTPDGSGTYGGGSYDLVGPIDRFAYKTRPVRPGETLALYGVGFGPTDPSVPAGQAFTGAAPTTNPVTVTIGGEAARVLFQASCLRGCI